MATESAAIVQRLWNYCNVLRDDGVSYGDYVEQFVARASKGGKGKPCPYRKGGCRGDPCGRPPCGRPQ